MSYPMPITQTNTDHRGTVRIDSGPALPTVLTITTLATWLPPAGPYTDPGWEFIDGAGHWHGFTEDAGLLPTLTSAAGVTHCRQFHRPGEDCPGYHVPVFTCRLCGEAVTVPLRPARADDPATDIPTQGWWAADVEHDLPAGRVQARFTLLDGTTLIGIGEATPGRLKGTGALATRGVAGLAPMRFHQVGPPA
jgi:hypothetical protein